jgi:hypothetical protein
MSDFYQTGVVATFHQLGQINLDKIEEEHSWYAVRRVSTFLWNSWTLPNFLLDLNHL